MHIDVLFISLSKKSTCLQVWSRFKTHRQVQITWYTINSFICLFQTWSNNHIFYACTLNACVFNKHESCKNVVRFLYFLHVVWSTEQRFLHLHWCMFYGIHKHRGSWLSHSIFQVVGAFIVIWIIMFNVCVFRYVWCPKSNIPQIDELSISKLYQR